MYGHDTFSISSVMYGDGKVFSVIQSAASSPSANARCTPAASGVTSAKMTMTESVSP